VPTSVLERPPRRTLFFIPTAFQIPERRRARNPVSPLRGNRVSLLGILKCGQYIIRTRSGGLRGSASAVAVIPALPIILTRGSRPEVVMIPYEQYLKYVQTDEAGVLTRFDKLLERMAVVNANYSEEEVEADLIEATRAVRKRK